MRTELFWVFQIVSEHGELDMNKNLVIAIVAVIVVVVFAVTVFTANNQAPEADGARTANEITEQKELPAGPASDPAELTDSGS